MGNAERWQASALGPADSALVRHLFAQVFDAPMSEALWRWKYRLGGGCASGARHQGELVAHYGGTPRTLCAGSQQVTGTQMIDVMVRRDLRGILSRRGPFAATAQHFISTCVGSRFDLGFGFPSARHARLGELLGLYRPLGEVLELRWPSARMHGWKAWRYRWAQMQWGAEAALQLDDLWRIMRRHLSGWVLPQRDAAWCQYRYAQHPQNAYMAAMARCRITQRVLGVAVIKPSPATWEWMDWIGAPKHLPLALDMVRDAAARAGTSNVTGWFSAPLAQHLQQGKAANTAAQCDVACSWCVTLQRADGMPSSVDTAPWWLTSGDTDFR